MTPEQREQAIEKIAKWQWARDGYPREIVTNRDPGPGFYFTRATALFDGALAPLLAEERRAGAEEAWDEVTRLRDALDGTARVLMAEVDRMREQRDTAIQALDGRP